MVDKEICQTRALEIVAGASISVSASDERRTTDGAKVVVGTTESVPIDYPVGSEKLDPPVC